MPAELATVLALKTVGLAAADKEMHLKKETDEAIEVLEGAKRISTYKDVKETAEEAFAKIDETRKKSQQYVVHQHNPCPFKQPSHTPNNSKNHTFS